MRTSVNEQINANAFMSLSKIAFSSVERLATLHLNTSRAAFDSAVGASETALHAKSDKTKRDMAAEMPMTASTNMVDYLKSVQEIATDTQKEIAELMSSYFGAKGDAANPGAGWMKGFDLFKSFGQQITSMTEANSKVAVDATERLTATATATAQGKKHA